MRNSDQTVRSATRAEVSVVYAAGAVQGIVLVTFPASSTIFTDPGQYGLSDTQYGALFLPQVAAAIGASLLGAWFARRLGIKRVYLAGLSCELVSMLLLIGSVLFESSASVRSRSCWWPPRFWAPASGSRSLR